ncbi:hypothetical protein ZIOFF_069813 [Zingiber officinale]|uniref:tRNA 2'-phosphotransferase 1 n=1 Tax=Zingiber officinale TaxID=94328 RepID=A0A8J5C6H5_ZINOF|nr:hypothetical protein ZIOFF_069813 [Zingiber officinale]
MHPDLSLGLGYVSGGVAVAKWQQQRWQFQARWLRKETISSESLLKLILSADRVPVCVHGTYRRNLESILQSGLKRMTRLHVHFSSGLPSDGEVISGSSFLGLLTQVCPWTYCGFFVPIAKLGLVLLQILVCLIPSIQKNKRGKVPGYKIVTWTNIQVSILTRGYEAWHNGEANLLITRGLVDDPEPLYNNNNTEEATVSNNFPFVLARKLTPNAVIPIQRTPGAVGFDLAASDCLAQIIFEQLLMPTIYEATSLSPTTRSHQGFGLPLTTNKDHHKRHPIWDTLGEPSGKFDYYVNYALLDPLPDLELPAPSWDDDTITTTPSILNQLLPREKHLASVCLEDTILQQERSPENHAGITSPWANVPRSIDLSVESTDMEDEFFDHIQYLADLTIPRAKEKIPCKWLVYCKVKHMRSVV